MKKIELSTKDILDNFRIFLSSAWQALPQWMLSNEDANEPLNDWLQANWECLVEYRLKEAGRLEVYGDGADCNGSSSRVFAPADKPTHGIYIDGDYLLHSFGTLRRGFYEMAPPFDYVKAESATGTEHTVKFSDAIFELKVSEI